MRDTEANLEITTSLDGHAACKLWRQDEFEHCGAFLKATAQAAVQQCDNVACRVGWCQWAVDDTQRRE